MNSTDYNNCVSQHSDSLYRFARKSCGDEDDAKDIVQQAFEVLWAKKEDVPIDKAKSFLFTIAYRRSMDKFRKPITDDNFDTYERKEQVHIDYQMDLKNILNKALTQLDANSRMLILLKDVEGYSYEEMAKLTDYSETQIKVYLHRARKKMKALIGVSPLLKQ